MHLTTNRNPGRVLLIVAPMREELDAAQETLLRTLGDDALLQAHAPILNGELPYMSIPMGDTTYVLAALGMGKVNATLRTNALLWHLQNVAGVLLFGTAGGLRDHVHPHTLYAIQHTWQHDYGLALGDEFVTVERGTLPTQRLKPSGHQADLALQSHLNTRFPQLEWATTVSGDCFVASDAHRERLAATADLVDMETAAVAEVCYTHDMPWLALRTVSDAADGSAQQKFAESLAELTTEADLRTMWDVAHAFSEYVTMQ